MGDGEQTGTRQANRWLDRIDWVAAEIVVTSILSGIVLQSWWVGIGLAVVLAGLKARPDGRWSLATLSAFCWVGLGATGWTLATGLPGGVWAGLVLGGAVFSAHRLLPPPPPVPKPETRAELHRAQVERGVRDVLVIAMILLALFGFFWVGSPVTGAQ